jgi:hypothetical protein
MAGSIEDRYRWKIGIDGRSISMESVTKTPDTGSIKRIVNRMGSEDLVIEMDRTVPGIQRR